MTFKVYKSRGADIAKRLAVFYKKEAPVGCRLVRSALLQVSLAVYGSRILCLGVWTIGNVPVVLSGCGGSLRGCGGSRGGGGI